MTLTRHHQCVGSVSLQARPGLEGVSGSKGEFRKLFYELHFLLDGTGK